MNRSAGLLQTSIVLLTTAMPCLAVSGAAAEQPPSFDRRDTAMHMTTLAAAPTALTSDRYGRLFAAVPGAQGGLFVVDGKGEARQFIAGGVSGVAGSRDGKLFLARGAAILQIDLDAAWALTDVTGHFACSGEADRTITSGRDGSVWIDGCAQYREASGQFAPRPPGPGNAEAPRALAYDLYDNHWSLARDRDGSRIVAVRAADAPEAWQVAAQPEGEDWRHLAIDANGFVWVWGGSGAGLRRLDPHRPQDGWHTPTGAEAWTGEVTAVTRSPDDAGLLFGFDDGTVLDVVADSAATLASRPVVAGGEMGPIDQLHVDSLGRIWLAAGTQVHRLQAKDEAWQRSWESVTPLPGGNHDIFAVELADQLYVAGGLTAGWGYPAAERVFAELFRYDPRTRSWTVAGTMPSARCHNGLTAFEEEVWVVGGRANPDDPHHGRDLEPLDDVIVFDPASARWRVAPSLNTARTEPVALAANGRVYAIGGSDTAAGNALSSVESIGPGEDSWRYEAATPRPIRQFAGCVLDDVLYVVGSEGAFAYDPNDGTWDDLPAPEHLPQASYVTAYEGEIWALGDHRTKKSWRYSPAERTWRPGPDLPTHQSWGGAAVLDGRLYVVGGAHWSMALDSFIWDDRVFVLRPDWSRRAGAE